MRAADIILTPKMQNGAGTIWNGLIMRAFRFIVKDLSALMLLGSSSSVNERCGPAGQGSISSDDGRSGRKLVRVYVPAAVVCAATLLVAALHWMEPAPVVPWHGVVQQFFYIPIAYAAVQFGWRGGLAAAVLGSLLSFPGVPRIWGGATSESAAQYLQIALFCSSGVFAGMLADRERGRARRSEETAARLAKVYEELQDNFERMKRAERLYALGQLSAGLAHEIRNPLASIAGAVGILRRRRCSEEKAGECLEILSTECQRLNRLLTSFLEFARPRSPNFQTVSVGSVFGSVLGLAEHAVDGAPIRLRGECLPGLVLDCDPEQLSQVLLNLVINAIQAMPGGGEVLLSARLTDGMVAIEVQDEGGGVSEKDMEHLYDPFFTTKENGTGLGLPVAHQIVAQLGGSLTAEHRPGGGMTFSVRLPLEHRGNA
jgi:two-component system, NtrC family, sensor histidine kinase HydH